MRSWNSGDTSNAICHECKTLVSTTFAHHDVPFESSGAIVADIMAATCDECGAVVAIPPQSTPAIKAALNGQLDHAPKVCVMEAGVSLAGDDYNGVAIKEWEVALVKDVRERCGDIILNATWEPAGEAGG
jgi:hypothetical protein